MTLEEYVEGHQSKDSFCYWLEQKTDPVGRLITGGAGYGFNVYYSKKNSATLFRKEEKEKLRLKMRQTRDWKLSKQD